MGKKVYIVYLFVVTLLSISNLTAQENIRFDAIELPNNISNSWIQDSFQDGKGFICFVKRQGLNRYDGYELKTFNASSDIWITVTFLTSPEPKEKLLSFYRRVRLNARWWTPIAKEEADIAPLKDGILNLINWICVVAMIYSFLFGFGQIILGSLNLGIIFLITGFVLGSIIFYQMNKRGWEILSD